MKIKDMINKLHTYNEVAEAIGERRKELRFSIRYGYSHKVEDMKSFKKFLHYEFIEELVEAILNYDGYEFAQTAELSFTDKFGEQFDEEVEFTICTEW